MGSDWVGNPGLRPTRNTGIQAGANYRYGRVLASGTVRHDWVSDFVTIHGQPRSIAVPGIMNATARSYINVDARMLVGEFSATWLITDRLAATADASVTRARKATDPAAGITSPYLSEIPPATGTVSVRYSKAAVFGEARAVFAASQRRVDADLMEAPTPGYSVLDVKVGAQVKQVRLSVSLDNVFNRLYLTYASYQRDPYRSGARVREPGRNLYASLSYRF
jgi:iron complex outermembrane receptor protein